ncbi:cation-independent mannose-6-phosphate receptor [Halyomorpha halys]|uniref:cation-independent mannose-6-phosphate receptor n=1 Tax=Halyomorpha halys TaxID=286706 RepID=UPI0034D3672F
MNTNCPSYVCEADNGVPPKPLSNAFDLTYLQNKGLSFNYPTLKGGKIVINVICSPGQEDYKLNYVSHNKHDLFFSINTSLVCDFPAINCLLHSQENNIAYDLYPLNKMIDNYEWKLRDGKRLLLNICGPLNYIPQVQCADGLRNFGCIVDTKNQTEAALTFANVSVIEPGLIVMVYIDQQRNNILNITFQCSKDVSVSPSVSATGITNVINFNINWNTYAACPLKYSAGENCEVKNLYNGSKVKNLMPLHKTKTDYFIVNGKESFRINVCGALTQPCSRNRNAAVCFKNSNGTEIAIGETGALKPNFIDGQFIFNLEGAPCHGNATKSRVKIIMACEFPSTSTSSYQPELFPSTKENECIYYFYWKTPLVCGSAVSSKCTFSNEVVKYDLSSLINLRENYIVNYNDSEIEINICHSLIPGHRIHCHELSGACLKNYSINSILSAAHSNHENNENLGLASEHDDFEISGNKIRLYYRNGGVCISSKVESVYSTTIDFICNKTASDTEPKLISIEDCVYNFSWTTSAACPTYKGKAPCSIDVSNKTFDLSNFMGKTYEVEIKNTNTSLNFKITIGICSPVDIIGCSSKSGSCLVESGTAENLGNYNSTLQYVNESLLLVYETDNCKSTVIEFSCGQSESSGPVLIKRNNCSTIISWSTRFACHDDYGLNEMKCCQGIEDLCEKLNQTYEVDISNKEKAFINVCKPLLPKWGVLCPSGSVSCLANNESLDYFSSEKSLGSFVVPPVLLNDKTVVLKYFDGSVCHKESDTRYSTSITFICDENVHIGNPVLTNISEDCQYEFQWATSLICHEKCTLPIGNKNIDVLQQFRNWDKRIYTKNGSDKSPYILNLCQVSARCGSHICKMDRTSKWLRFGELNSNESRKVSDSKTSILYKYFSSDVSKDSCGAQVDLICDNSDRGPGRPYLEKVSGL